MLRIMPFFAAAALFVSAAVFAQDGGTNKNSNNAMISEVVEDYGKDMDKLIADWSKRIEDLIKKYEMTKLTDIRILPYQTDLEMGDGYIEVEKHFFIKDPAKRRNAFSYKDITGIRIKRIRVYTGGESVSKIETTVTEKFFSERPQNEVIIVDPSPTSEGTDDVTITYIYKGKTIVNDKKLADVRNRIDYPVRNDIKSDFLVPNLNICYNALMFIAEAYYGAMKDPDKFVSDYLRDAADYQ